MSRLGAAMAVITAGLVAPSAATPAYAFDQYSCSGAAGIFNSTTTGTLVRRDLTGAGNLSPTWGTAKTIDSGGWQNAGRILGGTDGRVYTITSSGLFRYRWTGSTWELIDGKTSLLMDSGFTQYATTAYRNKITVDELGDFYLIDSAGKLRWYRYDEAGKKWSINGRTLDNGWDKYDMLVAAGPGVLYARTPTGALYRHRFDQASQRWIRRDLGMGGADWASYTKGFFSVGGETVFGITSNGTLYQQRFRDVDPSRPVMRPEQIGTGWTFPNVFATTNTCHQGDLDPVPVWESTPTQPNSPLAVMQAPAVDTALGTVEYAYVDNIGRVLHGRQTNPDALGSIQWETVDGIDSYTGKPALVADNQKRINLVAQQTTRSVRSLTQASAGSPTWSTWSALGGIGSEPTAVQLSDGSLALFALSGGSLWVRQQDGNTADQLPDLLPWSLLGGSGLTGTPVVNVGANGSAMITATDGTGAVLNATYQNRTLTAPFASVGGTGFTGTPSVVMMPGRRPMIFARHADGTIKKQYQNSDGTWSGNWTTVGAGGMVPVGNPSALLDPVRGRIVIVNRGTDGKIYSAWETGQGTEVWGNWTTVEDNQTYPVDPTAFTYQSSNGTQVGYATRNVNGTVAVYLAQDGSMLNRNSASVPTFTSIRIPQPPRR